MTMAYKKRQAWLLVLTVGLGILLNPLNSSMVSVALTRMQADFGLTFADASWLISVFYIASAAGQPVMGKLSDMFGPKRLFLAGLTLVAVASLLAPFSPHYGMLLVWRTLQAIGSSTLFPSGMNMVRSHITEGQAQAIAYISIFASTSAAFGPSIGGFLIAGWDWQAIFFVNFPFIITSFVLAIFILPQDGEDLSFDWKRIDWIGILLFIIGIVSLILFLLSLEETMNGWALLMAILSFTMFYFYENRHHEPFISIETLKKNPTVSWVYIQFTIICLIYYCYFFGLPTFLQQVKHYSAHHTGLIMLALAGFSVVVAPFVGRMVDRHGSKPAMLVGAVLMLIGTGLLLTYDQTSSLVSLIIMMAILGMSTGFNNLSTQTALYEHVSQADTGSASGLFQTSRYVGSILSASVLGLTFNRQLDLESFHQVIMICFICCFLVLAIAMKMPARDKVSSR